MPGKDTNLWLKDIKDDTGIACISRHRPSRGGGVAIFFDTKIIDLKRVPIPGNSKCEIVAAAGNLKDQSRRLAIICGYLPPSSKVAQVATFFETMENTIEKIKSSYPDPMIVVTGDMNGFDMKQALMEHPDVVELPLGPTRGTRDLDRCATNFSDCVTETSIRGPLYSNVADSDHGIIHITAAFERFHQYETKTFSYMKYDERGAEKFGDLLQHTDWTFMENETDPTAAVEKFNNIVSTHVKNCFENVTKKIRSCDPPWIDNYYRRILRRKRRLYREEKRSAAWKRLSTLCEQVLNQNKLAFFEKMRTISTKSNNSRAYFRAVSALGKNETSEGWDIMKMFPGKDEKTIAQEAAQYFNRISSEFEPLDPRTHVVDASNIAPSRREIRKMLQKIRKPKSRVPGDIFPQLVGKFAHQLSLPLKRIYDLAFKTSSWPSQWTREFVTLIPKKGNPQSLADLRNLSCTALFSKVLESFVLNELRKDVKVSERQFGGIKGSGCNHFLIETWHEILLALEDSRASANVISVDYEKAFNRMSYQGCISALLRLGGRQEVISMVCAFLRGRTMQVRINQTLSDPLPVDGGSPQGSILGNSLFCIATDHLSEPPSLDNNHGYPQPALPNPIPPHYRPAREATPTLADDDEDGLPFGFRYCRVAPRRLDDTITSPRATQTQLDEEIGPAPGWVPRQLQTKVYVDDLNGIEKVSRFGAVSQISQARRKVKVHAPESEKLFDQIHIEAPRIGMRVNASKTQLLCISHPSGDEVTSYIHPSATNQRIESTDELKILGFWFGPEPNVSLHVKKIEEHFRGKLWSLRKLTRWGMPREDLVKNYTTVLRPTIEYAAETYSSMLTSDQSARIESLQAKAMKVIFGDTVSYGTVIDNNIVDTLSSRRKEIVKKFARKTVKNERYRDKWFPKHNPRRELRQNKTYLEENTRNKRMFNSPIYAMRRILNNDA